MLNKLFKKTEEVKNVSKPTLAETLEFGLLLTVCKKMGMSPEDIHQAMFDEESLKETSNVLTRLIELSTRKRDDLGQRVEEIKNENKS